MSIGGEIWKGAFQGCNDLKSVAIPDSVTSIGDYAFRECNALTSVKIGNGVTSIGRCAFYLCCKLKSLTIGTCVESIGDSAFDGCSGLTNVTIPDSVTSIGPSAFAGCGGLTSVTIPNRVTSIGYAAFASCSGLTSVTIPDSVTNIEHETFANCANLTSVTIGKGVESIEYKAFANCTNLTSVTIGKGVTSIGDGTFKGCRGLADGEGFVIVGNVLYDYVGKLKRVTIPDRVTCIGAGAFEKHSNLMAVKIPDSVTSIGSGAFEGCSDSLFDMKTILGVELVDGWVVNHKRWLSGDLNLAGVRGIGYGAFSYCSGLTSVTLPKHLEGKLPEDEFADCSDGLKITYCDVTAPEKKPVPAKRSPAGKVTFEELALRVVDYINNNGNYAASLNGGEVSIKIGSERLHWDDARCFLADQPHDVFRLVRNWDRKWDILGQAQRNFVRKCEKLLRIEGKTPEELAAALDAVGIKPAENVESRLAAAKSAPKKVDWKFVRKDGGVEICGIKGKVSGELVIPDVLRGHPVTSIGAGAFKECSGLVCVTIGDNVTSIGERAFADCSGLTSVTIGNSVTSIGEFAFWNCDGIECVTVPESVASIGRKAFIGCRCLRNVSLPESIKGKLSEDVFEGCPEDLKITYRDNTAAATDPRAQGDKGKSAPAKKPAAKKAVKKAAKKK